MKYLVTGGAGFIGSHIAERLLKDGHDVVVLDNFYSGKQENIDIVSQYAQRSTQYELIRGDIRNREDCLKATEGVEAIFHQAALRSVPASMKAPHSYNDVNIDGILTLLEAARDKKVKRLVFASSSSVYGDVDKFPQKEDAYPLLISPYALSKLAGEYYLRIFNEHYGLETVSLRYFNVFGPRQALDDEYAVVIPKFIDCVLNDKQPPIFGNGKQSRDFTYVKNVVEANLRAASVEEAAGHVFNVANGADTTVLGLVDKINAILGKNIEPQFLPIRAGDVFRTLADVTKLETILGFKDRISFDQGLAETVEYFQKSTVNS